MLKLSNKHLLLTVIIAFAFAYRLFFMFGNTFPPGADIGLHNSVINSITQSGNTDFLYNFYQMGGGLSLTFPGFHIVTSSVIALTGMPDFVAQAVVVAFFSAMISAGAFLVTRSVWSETAALIVAFLVAVSRFDIEMLMWAGYPNAVALFLIPVTFYLFLKREKLSSVPFLVSTAILSGSIFLTHSLSAAIFVSITTVLVLSVLVSPKTFGSSRKSALSWLLSLVFGAVLVSPFLVEAVPDYLFANSTFAGTPDSRLALLSTRVLPLEIVLPLFLIAVAFLLFSKKFSGRYVSLPFYLLIVWLVVPLVFTQGYLFGLVVDYNRFLYFVILPVIVFAALLMDYGAEFFSRIIDTYLVLTNQIQKLQAANNKFEKWLSQHLTRKALYSIFTVGFLLFAFLAVPIFVTPPVGQAIENYYQTMTPSGFKAIDWAKQNTPADAVFVADALYGWWFGGFAQRPTLSAVDPQYLTLNREFEPAKFAKNLLDTDYVIDNGYIQVREDGAYIGRHNPMIMADVNWTYFPYAFFQFNSSIIFLISNNVNTNVSQVTDLTQIPVTSMQLLGSGTDSPSIVVNKSNSDISYSEIITLSKGTRFANMTLTFRANNPNISLGLLQIILNSQGEYKGRFGNTTAAMLDAGAKECGQLIFAKNQPENITGLIALSPQYPCMTQIMYNLQGKATADIQLLVGLYPVTDAAIGNDATLKETLVLNVENQQTETDLPIFTFDYKAEMQAYNVSYVIIRVSELYPKFAKDPAFNLVFINDEVAIFKVKG